MRGIERKTTVNNNSEKTVYASKVKLVPILWVALLRSEVLTAAPIPKVNPLLTRVLYESQASPSWLILAWMFGKEKKRW